MHGRALMAIMMAMGWIGDARGECRRVGTDVRCCPVGPKDLLRERTPHCAHVFLFIECVSEVFFIG